MTSPRAVSCFLLLAAVAWGQPKGSIEGKVVNAITGEPLKRATVKLDHATERMPALTTETSDEGRFAFTGVRPGAYELSASRRGFLDQSYGSRRHVRRSAAITVAQEQPVKDIVVRLMPGGVISGRVFDDGGEPAEGADVRVFHLAWRNGRRDWVSVGGYRTLDNGEYRVPRLVEGRYLVSASRGHQDADASAQTLNTYYPSTPEQSTAAVLEVGPGAEVQGIDIRMQRSRVFHVRGKVVPPPGAGFNGATVFLLGADGRPQVPGTSASTDPGQGFDLARVLPGSYVLFVQSGSLIARQPVDVANGDLNGVTMAMAAAGDIQGTVKIEGATARPDLRRVSVEIDPQPLVSSSGFIGGTMGGNEIGEDLRFSARLPARTFSRFTVDIRRLPETCYVKSIRYGGQEAPDSEFDLVPGAALEITIGADAGRVSGTAQDKDGKPVPGAVVALVPESGKGVRVAAAGEDGSYTFAALPPGEYKLLAWEDVEEEACQDPDFVKLFESRATRVKVEPSGQVSVPVKCNAADPAA